MKKEEVKINGVYAIKVGRNLTGIRIMSHHPDGGWNAVNLTSSKEVHIKAAASLQGPWNPRSKKKATVTAPAADGGEEVIPSNPKAKATKKTNPGERGEKPAKKLSGLAAAAQVLAEAGEPLSSKAIVEQMIAKGYWATNGHTPASTIYAAIIREIQSKGEAARFRKTDRGKFTRA